MLISMNGFIFCGTIQTNFHWLLLPPPLQLIQIALKNYLQTILIPSPHNNGVDYFVIIVGTHCLTIQETGLNSTTDYSRMSRKNLIDLFLTFSHSQLPCRMSELTT